MIEFSFSGVLWNMKPNFKPQVHPLVPHTESGVLGGQKSGDKKFGVSRRNSSAVSRHCVPAR